MRKTTLYLPEDLKRVLAETATSEGFFIDRHPECPRVFVAAGFSGHGFKFCSVVGEVLADLALRGRTDFNIDLFRFDRIRP